MLKMKQYSSNNDVDAYRITMHEKPVNWVMGDSHPFFKRFFNVVSKALHQMDWFGQRLLEKKTMKPVLQSKKREAFKITPSDCARFKAFMVYH